MSQKTTLQDYLSADLVRGVIDHRLRTKRDADGGISFYIHPVNIDGDTPTYRVQGNMLVQLVQLVAGEPTPTEQELQLAAEAPRLTAQDIEAKVASEQYHVPPGTVHTVCVLTLANGFTVVGQAVCLNPAKFRVDTGRRLARENALDKVWELEGYLLRQKLHEQSL